MTRSHQSRLTERTRWAGVWPRQVWLPRSGLWPLRVLWFLCPWWVIICRKGNKSCYKERPFPFYSVHNTFIYAEWREPQNHRLPGMEETQQLCHMQLGKLRLREEKSLPLFLPLGEDSRSERVSDSLASGILKQIFKKQPHDPSDFSNKWSLTLNGTLCFSFSFLKQIFQKRGGTFSRMLFL